MKRTLRKLEATCAPSVVSFTMNEEEVREYLWEKFQEYMAGKTVALNEDGSIDYYESDVRRFVG